jgi:hypothetical protein
MLIQDHRQVMILEPESGVIDRRRRAGYSVCAGDKILDDRGHHGRHLTGSTMMGWIDQTTLIIGPICRHDPTTVENSS